MNVKRIKFWAIFGIICSVTAFIMEVVRISILNNELQTNDILIVSVLFFIMALCVYNLVKSMKTKGVK